jgi:hypothetical protein|tara:strand:+ start:49676 stop:49954 length:279 start_codon:yes stop_codon:yes gene_type:complete
MKKAFNIPAIDNEKEVLMQYLNLNSDDPSNWSNVKVVETVILPSGHRLRVFEYNNDIYHVAHSDSRIDAERLMYFNSNHYRISLQNSNPSSR